MDLINKIAKKNSLFVIEDYAAALGAKYDNKLVGTLSMPDVILSILLSILLQWKEVCLTESSKLANKVRKLSSFGYNKTLQEEVYRRIRRRFIRL